MDAGPLKDNLSPTVSFESVTMDFLTTNPHFKTPEQEEIPTDFLERCKRVAPRIVDSRSALMEVAAYKDATELLALMFLKNEEVPDEWRERIVRNVVLRDVAQMEIGMLRGIEERIDGREISPKRQEFLERDISKLERLIEGLRQVAQRDYKRF